LVVDVVVVVGSTTVWPAVSPEVTWVVLSPATPVVIRTERVVPPLDTVTVLPTPVVVMAVVDTYSTLVFFAVVTVTVPVWPSRRAAGGFTSVTVAP